MKQKQVFKRVVLFARSDRSNPSVAETLKRLTEFLQAKAINHVLYSPELAMEGEGDLMIVVGGDGSLLSGARFAVEQSIPVIGINRGRLGFLTDISPNHFETSLQQVLSGEYREEQRFLLKLQVSNEDRISYTADALNDVVLARGHLMHLVMFDVHINQQFVGHYRSDGLIISTPTGSTAYALSAGGPILHPEMNAMVIVPMFSHSLSSRPLVVDGNSMIEVFVSQHNDHALQVSCDGQTSYTVKPGYKLTITQKSQRLRLLHPLDYHYYDTLRIKLGWGGSHQKTC